jgi:6-phosphogluconate dehydrogenase (decarboxylating)
MMVGGEKEAIAHLDPVFDPLARGGRSHPHQRSRRSSGPAAVPANVLSAAPFARYRSRVEATLGDRLLSAVRLGFGGHVEVPK